LISTDTDFQKIHLLHTQSAANYSSVATYNRQKCICVLQYLHFRHTFCYLIVKTVNIYLMYTFSQVRLRSAFITLRYTFYTL